MRALICNISLLTLLLLGCSSTVPVEEHGWTRYSIKRFQILKETIVCDSSDCNEKMETIRDAAFVPGEYWSKNHWNGILNGPLKKGCLQNLQYSYEMGNLSLLHSAMTNILFNLILIQKASQK